MYVLHNRGTLYAGAVFLVLVILFSKSLALYTTTSPDKCNNWFYSGVLGQDKWGTFCPTCKGDNQSPIDIQDHIALYAPNLDLLAMSGHDTPADMQLVNYGRSVYLDLGQAGEYWLWNGNLPGRYLANQAHFHWGQDSSRGSDHTINGRQFPLEMHILYDLIDQVKSREMMAVLSVLFEVSDEDNPNLMPILYALPRVTEEGSETIITRFTISSLFPPNMNMFYRYYGGLTTPPCTESVVWTVYKRRVSVSERQLHIFRQYLTFNNNGGPAALVDNFRKTQPLNNRIIYSTENEAGVKAGGFAAIAIVMVILVFTVYAFVAFYLPRYRAAHMAKQEEKQPIIDE